MKAYCHICDCLIREKVVAYYYTKFINNYGLPVSFCKKCIPILLDKDHQAWLDDSEIDNSNADDSETAYTDDSMMDDQKTDNSESGSTAVTEITVPEHLTVPRTQRRRRCIIQ